MNARLFPPPWSIEELEACFIVKDSAGQKLAFIYFEDEPGRRAAAKLPTKDEAYLAGFRVDEMDARASDADHGLEYFALGRWIGNDRLHHYRRYADSDIE
jgi:hypothetical protein